MQNPRVTFQMNTGRTIVLELLPDQAPNTVRSFLWLARNDCYTGHSIQRIVPGYVVDASYNAFGKEIACYLIDNESTSHGFPNHLRLESGTIAMGGYGELGIAGGEFFFPLAWNEKLQDNYPGFGRVIEGFDEIQRWAELPTRKVTHPSGLPIEINEPLSPITIDAVTVETFGVDYPEPTHRPMRAVPPGWPCREQFSGDPQK